jgi:preprotein translocase subunit SecG
MKKRPVYLTGEFAGLIVVAFGFIALCIALGCIYKKRQQFAKGDKIEMKAMQV